jgi:hypothetical protein
LCRSVWGLIFCGVLGAGLPESVGRGANRVGPERRERLATMNGVGSTRPRPCSHSFGNGTDHHPYRWDRMQIGMNVVFNPAQGALVLPGYFRIEVVEPCDRAGRQL